MRRLAIFVFFLLPSFVFAATDFDALTSREDCSLIGAEWTANITGNDTGTVITSTGRCTRSGSGNPGSAWWHGETFGPDIAIAALASDAVGTSNGQYIILWVLIQNPGSAGSQDGYNCQFLPEDEIVNINRQDNSVFGAQQSCSSLSNTINSNDKFACEKIGSSIKAYINHGAGWIEECSWTESTYTGTGYVGIQINTQQLSFDDIAFDTLEGSAFTSEEGLWFFAQ